MGTNSYVCIFFILVWLTQFSSQQPPLVTTCTDPLVEAHLQTFTHSYCFHACGFLQAATVNSSSTSLFGSIVAALNNGQPIGDSADAFCDPSGICVCQAACPLNNPRVQTSLDTTLCDPTLTTPSNLASTCEQQCRTYCGRNVPFFLPRPTFSYRNCMEITLLGPNQDRDARICTCSCDPNELYSCFDVQGITSRVTDTLASIKLFKLAWKLKFVLKKMLWLAIAKMKVLLFICLLMIPFAIKAIAGFLTFGIASTALLLLSHEQEEDIYRNEIEYESGIIEVSPAFIQQSQFK